MLKTNLIFNFSQKSTSKIKALSHTKLLLLCLERNKVQGLYITFTYHFGDLEMA